MILLRHHRLHQHFDAARQEGDFDRSNARSPQRPRLSTLRSQGWDPVDRQEREAARGG
jgi:hypothetical protein